MADAQLIKEMERFEGDRLRAYRDTRGLWTIGVGHCLTKDELSSGKIRIGSVLVPWRNGLTESQVDTLLDQDLALAEASVHCLVKVPLTQGQHDALVSFVFNCGACAFQGSTLRQVINAGHYEQAPAQFLLWVHNHDESVNNGLKNRREAEIELWNGKVAA